MYPLKGIFARVYYLCPMNTYKEVVYMILDELKLFSDDAVYTEDHIVYMASKCRSYILKQQYSSVKRAIPESDYQELCIDLEEVPAIDGEPCEGGYYLRSTKPIPYIMPIGNPSVYPLDFYQGDIAFIPRERMKYVGHNKYLKNIIYCSIAPNGYLYFKSANPQFLYLEKVKVNAIFEDPDKASELQCNTTACEDILDKEFPLEDSFIPMLIQMCVKEIAGVEYHPTDEINDAADTNPKAAAAMQQASQPQQANG